MMIELEKYTYDNTKKFSLENYITLARVVDIYDGDTCTCVIPYNNKFYKYQIRLNKIDTNELKSKDINIKHLALVARKRLFELITDNLYIIDINISKINLRKILNEKCYIIKIKCGKFDKYGRLLGYIFNNSSDCSDIKESYNYCLVKEHLAYIYNGGTKDEKFN